MYAEGSLDTCQCVCRGITHGLMAPNVPARAYCSPAAASRCQNGDEGTECHCACGGANHGLYKTIPDFESIKITGYAVAH
jgi:hypothetical protein